MSDIEVEVSKELPDDEIKAAFFSVALAGLVGIEFKKADGTIREMTCTLNPELIEEEIGPQEPSDKPARKENPEVQRVFDWDKKAWRSFRWDRLL